jgi:biopolymer transport protein ExbB/TolQ
MKMRLGLIVLLLASVVVWLSLQKKSVETVTIEKQNFDVELQTTKELEKLREQQLEQELRDADGRQKQEN